MLELKISYNKFLGNDTVLCKANEYLLKSPFDKTRWFDGDIAKTKIVNSSSTYWASFVDTLGCETTDSIVIQFNEKSFVPNVFSPNNDGINDCFQPYFSDQATVQYRFGIFDRWGSPIFSSNNPNDCWNGESGGKKCAPDVYTYFIELKTEYCEKTVLKGDVTLIR